IWQVVLHVALPDAAQLLADPVAYGVRNMVLRLRVHVIQVLVIAGQRRDRLDGLMTPVEDEQPRLLARPAARRRQRALEHLADLLPALLARARPLVRGRPPHALLLHVRGDAVAVLRVEDGGVSRAGLDATGQTPILLAVLDAHGDVRGEHADALVADPVPAVPLLDQVQIAAHLAVHAAIVLE